MIKFRKLEMKMPKWSVYIACFLLLIGVSATIYTKILNIRTAQKAKLFTQQNTELEIARKIEILNLATEFGYDPLIVHVVVQESSLLFHQRYCKCPTWRFVRTERELAYLLLSIISVESKGNYSAFNAGGPAYGLTQLLLSTARMYDRNVQQYELLSIPKNIHIAMQHFVDLLEKYHGNYMLAVLAWNRGSAGVDRSIAMGESPENGYAHLVFTQAAMENAK